MMRSSRKRSSKLLRAHHGRDARLLLDRGEEFDLAFAQALFGTTVFAGRAVR
jgi:hypothetical protein